MDHENRNVSPDEMLTRLAEILVEEGWLDDCFFLPMPKYQSPDTPEDDRQSWQQFKERLQKEGIW